MMTGDDIEQKLAGEQLDEFTEDVPDVAHSVQTPGPESLPPILSKALDGVSKMGGPDRAALATLIGRELYDQMLALPRSAKAIEQYLDAPPALKTAAGKMLAGHVARVSDHPEMVERIEAELEETFHRSYPTKPTARPDQRVRAQQRSGQRIADPDLMALARNSDISAYRQARLRPRGQQRQHRHGV